MTVYVDPVIGAAVVHLGLPILPGLPCPTCGGKRWRRAPAPWDEVLPGRPCPDCTDGVWTPPDSPVPIGVTSAEPQKGYLPHADDHQECPLVVQASLTDWWLLGSDGRSWEIVLSSMIGEGTLRKVKVVEADADGHGAVVEMRPDGSLWFWPEGAFGEDAATDISSALPFLPGLKPDDTVYLLDGFTASVECPECHGYCCLPIRLGSDGLFGGGGQCPSCLGTGCLSCPFPASSPMTPCTCSTGSPVPPTTTGITISGSRNQTRRDPNAKNNKNPV